MIDQLTLYEIAQERDAQYRELLRLLRRQYLRRHKPISARILAQQEAEADLERRIRREEREEASERGEWSDYRREWNQ